MVNGKWIVGRERGRVIILGQIVVQKKPGNYYHINGVVLYYIRIIYKNK
jgi:hypothetical protein